MRSSLGACDRMDLVDDPCSHSGEHPAPFERGQHDVQRLRRRDQNVRRLTQHPGARRRWCVARTNCDTNLRKLASFGRKTLAKLAQRPVQVSLDVVVESFEWRDVQQMYRVWQRLFRSANY